MGSGWKTALLGLALTVGSAETGTPLRTPAPAGWEVPAGRRLALVTGDEALCGDLRTVVARLQTYGMEGMVSAGGCRTAWAPWHRGEGAQGRITAVVVDEERVIRFAGTWPASAAGARAMGDAVLRWERGRNIFAASCGPCHGADGGETPADRVKPLRGIVTRMSDGVVLEHAERVGAVPVSTWPRGEVEALLVFLRGL